LAEDDDELRWALADLLRRGGYDVEAVANGAKLVDELAACLLPGGRPPDVIVTDIRMPAFNGLRVLEGFRAAGWSTPFILITAFGDDALRARAERAGATALLEKPFLPEELEAIVRHAVSPTT
jgi:CheY-like chemotaxis protein